MNYKGEIYRTQNTKTISSKKENRIKEKLMLNIWYNEFGLVYFKSLSFLNEVA